MGKELDAQFWNERYRQGLTGWDIGYPSTPIKEYIDQLENKDLRILIPGAGNAYEAEYLWENGFTNITVLDISEMAIESFKSRLPSFPENQLLHQDFFKHQGQYDLVLEQTFFCAIDPALRKEYANKMHELIAPEGRLAGVLFNVIFEKEGPPFGGHLDEYKDVFRPHFTIEIMEPCNNSIPPRSGAEAFIKLKKAD